MTRWRLCSLFLIALLMVFASVSYAVPVSESIKHDIGTGSAEAFESLPVSADYKSGHKLTLWYRNYAEKDWTALEVPEVAPGRYTIVIPGTATANPGVWYYFTADDGKIKTQEYFICTFIGPDNPYVVRTMTTPGRYVAWDIQAKNGALKFGTGAASTVSVKPLPTYATITSKYMEPRISEPTPHNAVDLAALNGTDVYAMQSGVVVAAVSPSSGLKYIAVGHGQRLSGVGELPLRYQYYSTYLHLSEIQPGITVGTSVNAGQPIGKSGNSGTTAYHLDCGFSVGGGPTGGIDDLSARLAMPMKYFFPSLVGDWGGGLDLDCAQPPITYYNQNEGTVVEVKAKPTEEDPTAPLVLTLYYRVAGSGTTWLTSPMINAGTSSYGPYRGVFGSAVDNKTVEYWIPVARPGRTPYWSTRPCEKASAEPSYYYTTVARPPIGGYSIQPEDSTK